MIRPVSNQALDSRAFEGGSVEDEETGGFDDADHEDGAEEDEDDLLDLIPPEDDRDPVELANIVRPELIAKAFKALFADAQRAGGLLSRDDANRAYLRWDLSIAERIDVEGKLAAAGYRISEDDDDDDDAKDSSVTTNRRKFRYLNHNEERELGRRIQLARNLPADTTGLPMSERRSWTNWSCRSSLCTSSPRTSLNLCCRRCSTLRTKRANESSSSSSNAK